MKIQTVEKTEVSVKTTVSHAALIEFDEIGLSVIDLIKLDDSKLKAPMRPLLYAAPGYAYLFLNGEQVARVRLEQV